MLTNPNEIVPLQIARGVLEDSPSWDVSLPLSFPPRPGEGRVGALLRAVLCAIRNILNSVRAAGGPAPGPIGRGLPRYLERVAQGLREPPRAGDKGAQLGHGPLPAAGRCGLASIRSPAARPHSSRSLSG